jgi:Fic family protein
MAHPSRTKSLALGRLDGIGRRLPGPEALLYSYVRKEAVLSSEIDGTQSTLRDLGIASELTGGKRNRVYLDERYLQILNRDVEA